MGNMFNQIPYDMTTFKDSLYEVAGAKLMKVLNPDNLAWNTLVTKMVTQKNADGLCILNRFKDTDYTITELIDKIVKASVKESKFAIE